MKKHVQTTQKYILPGFWWWIWLALFVSTIGCGPNGSEGHSIQGQLQSVELQYEFPATPVDFPLSNVDIIWLADGQFLVMNVTGINVRSEQTDYLLGTWGDWTLHSLFKPEECTRHEFNMASLLPDERLGLVEWCARDEEGKIDQNGQKHVVALDWRTGELEVLVEQALPPIGVNFFSWNPEMSRGVQDAGSLFRTIYWLTPEKSEPMEVTIVDGDRQWSLADAYHDFFNPQFGLAYAPVWSPDGSHIAFFASAAAMGKEGISRAMTPYKLYLMPVDTMQPEPVLAGILSAYRLTWSPDGRWLAVVGDLGKTRATRGGLWLYSPTEERLIRISQDDPGRVFWSPDGNKLLVSFWCEGCEQEETELILNSGESVHIPACSSLCRRFVIFDLTAVVAPNP